MKFLAIAALLTGLSAHAQAPVDAPPQDAPYTNFENEFDQANKNTQIIPLKAGEPEMELSDTPEVAPAPTADVPAPTETPAAANEPKIRQPPEQEDPRIVDHGSYKTYKGHRIVHDESTGKDYIHHPEAANGLTLIDRDGTYYYDPKSYAKNDQTSSFRIGQITPAPDINSTDGVTNFASMYGEHPITVIYDYEWKPLRLFGDLGIQTGFGFFTAQGNGHFDCIPGTTCLAPEAAHEKYTIYAIPLNLGVVYRFQYFDKQLIAPYVSGGVSYVPLAEIRDDNKQHFVGTPAAYGAGGLLISISGLDRELAFNFDSEYGIKTLWLSLEARRIQGGGDLNLTGNAFTLGIAADY